MNLSRRNPGNQKIWLAIQCSRHVLRSRLAAAFISLLLLAAGGYGANGEIRTHWVGSWAASQQLVEPANALSPDDLRDATLRQIVHLSIGGSEIRLRLSNRYGATPLHVTAAHLARPAASDSDKIIPGSDKRVLFSGRPEVTIPAHADYVSDPVSFPANALSNLAITLQIEAAPDGQTGHPGSRATSYVARGDLVSAEELPGAKTIDHWYFIAGIDVAAAQTARAVVVLGDSITDGHASTTNGNDRWTDFLAKALQATPATRDIAVLNQGIGGNRLLNDGLGPNALARFDSDVIAQPGVRSLIVLEGINDIGMLGREGEVPAWEHAEMVRRILSAYEQIVARAHTDGIQAIGATLMPFVGSAYYHPGAASEADRQAVNKWIRTPGHFDAVIDFDRLTRDPQHPERLLPAFDSGDHLHPSPTGYAAMGAAVPVSLFSEPGEPRPKIAFTFDDLPAHGPLPPGETRMEAAAKILTALKDAHMPPTYGFVNGLRVEEQPADEAVLRAWRAAGNPLGNHSWSHMNLNEHSLQEFEQDVARNEPILQKLMPEEDWRWFRFPYLAEGATPGARSGFREFLQARGYKIAAVTMSFGDYLWNEPYARCASKGDSPAIAMLEKSYLAAADETIGYDRSMSHTLYGRDIPYVLLMHVGAFDAEMLPRLLELYRARGFEFVTLPEAEGDGFYRTSVDLQLPPGPDSLEGAMSARHLALPAHKNFATELDSVCRER
jgi:lysophospholipase L1-like esterase